MTYTNVNGDPSWAIVKHSNGEVTVYGPVTIGTLTVAKDQGSLAHRLLFGLTGAILKPQAVTPTPACAPVHMVAYDPDIAEQEDGQRHIWSNEDGTWYSPDAVRAVVAAVHEHYVAQIDAAIRNLQGDVQPTGSAVLGDAAMGRLLLEASTGMHGDVAKQLTDAWCKLAERITPACAHTHQAHNARAQVLDALEPKP
jgi:hypothetical protein